MNLARNLRYELLALNTALGQSIDSKVLFEDGYGSQVVPANKLERCINDEQNKRYMLVQASEEKGRNWLMHWALTEDLEDGWAFFWMDEKPYWLNYGFGEGHRAFKENNKLMYSFLRANDVKSVRLYHPHLLHNVFDEIDQCVKGIKLSRGGLLGYVRKKQYWFIPSAGDYSTHAREKKELADMGIKLEPSVAVTPYSFFEHDTVFFSFNDIYHGLSARQLGDIAANKYSGAAWCNNQKEREADLRRAGLTIREHILPAESQDTAVLPGIDNDYVVEAYNKWYSINHPASDKTHLGADNPQTDTRAGTHKMMQTLRKELTLQKPKGHLPYQRYRGKR
ncbi:MAG: hypothetical protein KKC75_07095 [Nanoarchaeota archaeon]|nr:hypothetical protein [Nanoarchaeota archaeon]MBU1005454.1 hypothetical protein [Nanoarchaeota archaeon]MBU1947024.1 hypothetical protein [Nanoarchaeota archaeon]